MHFRRWIVNLSRHCRWRWIWGGIILSRLLRSRLSILFDLNGIIASILNLDCDARIAARSASEARTQAREAWALLRKLALR